MIVLGVDLDIIGSSGVSSSLQHVFGWASFAAGVGVVTAGFVWLAGWWRTRFAPWAIDYVDDKLAESLGTAVAIPVGVEADAWVRIRLKVARPIDFEELAAHPRKDARKHLLRRWRYKLKPEDIVSRIQIVDLADPEAEQYLVAQPGGTWVRSFTTVPSQDARGIWRGLFKPLYRRSRNEPVFLRVRLKATEPWHGYLFVRLLNDRDRTFRALRLRARIDASPTGKVARAIPDPDAVTYRDLLPDFGAICRESLRRQAKKVTTGPG